MNRLTRDQIITRALDMTDSPTLDAKERPDGVTITGTLATGWLQDGLDYFHNRFPFATDVKIATITWVTGQTFYSLPTDYIIDFADGIVLSNSDGRMVRKGLGFLLNIAIDQSQQWGKPGFYTITSSILVRPAPSAQWSGKTATFYYYAMPAILGASDVPHFPSDLILVRYVYLRGLEWTRAVAPGTADQYALQVVGDLQKQGIGNEAEDSQIPFDRQAFPGNRIGSDPNSWMGTPVVSG